MKKIINCSTGTVCVELLCNFAGSVDGKITQIDITPCSDPSDCGFQKGTTPSFTLQFTPSTYVFRKFPDTI